MRELQELHELCKNEALKRHFKGSLWNVVQFILKKLHTPHGLCIPMDLKEQSKFFTMFPYIFGIFAL